MIDFQFKIKFRKPTTSKIHNFCQKKKLISHFIRLKKNTINKVTISVAKFKFNIINQSYLINLNNDLTFSYSRAVMTNFALDRIVLSPRRCIAAAITFAAILIPFRTTGKPSFPSHIASATETL